jgi:hypothetical protein
LFPKNYTSRISKINQNLKLQKGGATLIVMKTFEYQFQDETMGSGLEKSLYGSISWKEGSVPDVVRGLHEFLGLPTQISMEGKEN